ncbi:IclR family transcriptional regulator [Plantactinospora sp. S1510]|uniref:IclR family transcriptional regulator n=1 Tax=Plantactinospora alkalitolerans TaxID=2789879 RepID=A0ABS0GRL6_9ACTN|nr:IclR family transcriptional regulator [Plantactinospora alkalitolerans]MBF9128833.1 IclR family transcriptional regulator [Plantactinospora alkalitolerans]
MSNPPATHRGDSGRSATDTTPPTPRTNDAGLSSVDNALRLLQLIGERRVLRVAEAAEDLGVARSTAHRLLSALRVRGFVMQDKPNGVYRPGSALNEIGLAAIGRIDIRRVARPIIEQLREETQETVSLLLLEGQNVRFMDCVESPRSVRVGSRTGLMLPAHCTAGGKAILAALPRTELLRRYPDGTLESRTESSIQTWEQLEAELATVREIGYAVNIEEGENGISAVGTAVRDLIGAPLAALAIAIPTSRMPTADGAGQFAPALAQAQATVTELLRAEL